MTAFILRTPFPQRCGGGALHAWRNATENECERAKNDVKFHDHSAGEATQRPKDETIICHAASKR